MRHRITSDAIKVKPPPFEYYRPQTLDEVVALMGQHGSDARPLAGGQSLVPLLNMRLLQPAVIIDMNACVGLDDIADVAGNVQLSAMARQASVERSALVKATCPLLAKALSHVGGIANRNRGTVCGSLAHADPLAELPCVAVALDAKFKVRGPAGARLVDARDFFVSDLATCMDPTEVLEEVLFPKWTGSIRAGFAEVGNRRHGFAVAGAAAQIQVDADGKCVRASIAAMGVGPVPLRLPKIEALLVGQRMSESVVAAAASHAAAAISEPRGDIHASADYRRDVLPVLVARALNEAMSGSPDLR